MNKEELKQQVKQQLEEYIEEIMNRITETNKKVEKTDENLIQFREEIINKINDVEDNNKTSIGILKKDTQEQFEILQNKVDEHYHQVEINVGQVQSQVTDNREKICLLYTSRCV